MHRVFLGFKFKGFKKKDPGVCRSQKDGAELSNSYRLGNPV